MYEEKSINTTLLPIFCDFQTKKHDSLIKTVLFTNILGILLQFLAIAKGIAYGFTKGDVNILIISTVAFFSF